MPTEDAPKPDQPESQPEMAGNPGHDSTHHGYYDDDYGYNAQPAYASSAPAVPEKKGLLDGGLLDRLKLGRDGDGDEDEDDDGMLRMSFLEHLEELRSRILKALAGLLVVFALTLIFAAQLWDIVRAPADAALVAAGAANAKLAMTEPTEAFFIIWMRLPLLLSIFLASPWILYQAWAFISPGLYKKERQFAVPFILVSAGLFITGGLFAYFVAFRFALAFLLGVGVQSGLMPVVTVTNYFDLFFNVILGIAIVFELPVLIFFLTLLRIASPAWLLDNSRYAILAIVIAAAIITPTPDVFNLMVFAVPMILLFFLGVFASYMLVWHREGKKFPWGRFMYGLLVVAVAVGLGLWLALTKYGFHWVWKWPFLVK